MSRALLAPVALLALLALLAGSAAAQGSSTLRRAEAAYRDLAYGQTIADARRALAERLTRGEQARAYELLGFAFAALDSARESTEAFKQLLFLNPDRELDAARISPKITNLFALALGQVLVIRRVGVDSGAFIAGEGALPIRFAVTRSARVRTRIVGPGGDAVVDSALADGAVRLAWNGLLRDGRPAPGGEYRLVVEAVSGRDSYAASIPLRIRAGAADTVPHLATLPGYEPLPETEVPPRSWRPLGIAFLATAATSGTIVALENSGLGAPRRGELVAIGVGTSVIGALATLRRPAAVEAPANIRYNALLREQLARRNAEIAADNARRGRQVKLTVAPLAAAATTKEGAP
jgi:hypothetical protein